MKYTDNEKKILQKYFTNTDADVFALINLPEVIKGSLFSRYSRSAKDLRRLFLDEFVKEKELNFIFNQEKNNHQALDLQRAEAFYERMLIGYGDDSVAELGGAHIALENISVLATKSIEEHRLGLSPLEKSTRYVYFDKKINGEYLFYHDQKIMKSKYRDLFITTNNFLFDTYSKIVREIQPILKKIYPGDDSDPAYKFSIRAKACDLARGLLPIGVKTNMGVFGNGRAYEYLLTNLMNDPLDEVKEIAQSLNENLKPVIPSFIKRATNERGVTYRDYVNKRDKSLNYLMKLSRKKPQPITGLKVDLVDYDKRAIEKIIAVMLYERTNLTYKETMNKTMKMGPRTKEKIFKSYLAGRKNRYFKPGRPTEEPYFSFEVSADWGVYKDLMRHRILTRYRQLFTNEYGYWIPNEIEMVGYGKIYRDAADRATAAYCKIKKNFPYEAQYLVLHGAYNRFYMKMNLRELIHFTELRSIPHGHPTYRKTAQEMAKTVSKKLPLLGKYAYQFVDYKDYGLERLSSFRKIQAKAKKLGIEAFKE